MKRIKKVDFENVNLKGKEGEEDSARMQSLNDRYSQTPEEKAEAMEQKYREFAALKCMGKWHQSRSYQSVDVCVADLHNEAYFRCMRIFLKYSVKCYAALPWGIDYLLCWPLRTKSLCKLLMSECL